MGVGLALFVLCSIGALTGLPTPAPRAEEGASADKKAISEKKPESLPISAFRYVEPILQISYLSDTKEISGVAKVKLKNTTDVTLRFSVNMAASINDTTSPNGTITFSGLVYPKDEEYLVYDRINQFPLSDKPTLGRPLISATIHYDMRYWAEGDEKLVRESGRDIRMEYWGAPIADVPGARELEHPNVYVEHAIER